MRGALRPEPKILAIFPSLNARSFSVRTKIPGSFCQFRCEVRTKIRSEPKSCAIFPSLCAMGFSVRTEIPEKFPQFARQALFGQTGCELCFARSPNFWRYVHAFFGQNQNSWRYFPICMRGVCRSEPKFLAVLPGLDAGCSSVGTRIPGGVSQFKCEVFVGRNQKSWRYFPVQMRGVFQTEPKFLAVFTNVNATRFSVRTEMTGDISQCKCDVSVGQNRNSWRYLPV